jgi:5-methylcytosine-specific restriction endonuclease McrA
VRSVEEWIGKTDDAMPPPRVRIRIFDTAQGRCRICGRKIGAGEYWQQGHIIALCNGGENREQNMAPECRNCCYGKTAADVAEKSAVYQKRVKHILPREPSRSFRKPEGYVYDWKTKRGRIER